MITTFKEQAEPGRLTLVEQIARDNIMENAMTFNTPRFGQVKINEVFLSRPEARDNGYTEPTYYEGDYEVYGKSIDMYHMIFCAVERTLFAEVDEHEACYRVYDNIHPQQTIAYDESIEDIMDYARKHNYKLEIGGR